MSARAAGSGSQLLGWASAENDVVYVGLFMGQSRSFIFPKFSFLFPQFEIRLIWEKKKIVISFHTDLFQNLKHPFWSNTLAN